MAAIRRMCIVSVVTLSLGVGGHVPCQSQRAGSEWSQAESALLRAYLRALRESRTREVSLEGFLRQMRHNPTVGIVGTYWATPIDLSSVLLLPEVHAAVENLLLESPSGGAVGLLKDRRRLRRLAAFAFSPVALREPLGLRVLGEQDPFTDSEPHRLDVVIVPVRDVDWAVTEYLPPMPAGGEEEPECYFFCLDPDTWDFDGDGIPDVRDEDNDNDGVEDRHDHYPNLPAASACNCDVEPFVLFVTKFAREMTSAVLDAHAVRKDRSDPDRVAAVGDAPGGGQVRFVLTPSARAANAPAQSCPAADDPAIRYVSTDPEVCARIRYRCDEGELGFSSECGCGCRRP